MLRINKLDTYMIVIEGDPISNYYFTYCKPSWEDYGFKVNIFKAETPSSIKNKNNIRFNKYNSSIKYAQHNLQVEITDTEKACWYSHYMLWCKCIEQNKPIMILEHDAFFYKPENFWINVVEYDLIFYDKAAMGSYLLTPSGANTLIRYVNKHTISTGVLAGIHDCYVNKYFNKKVHAHFTATIEPCVNQVYSKKYRNTIHHPSDDYPEIKWKQHDFIFID